MTDRRTPWALFGVSLVLFGILLATVQPDQRTYPVLFGIAGVVIALAASVRD